LVISRLEKNGNFFCSFGFEIWFKVDDFTSIVLTIIVPVFDLGMSFGNVKSGKSRERVWKVI